MPESTIVKKIVDPSIYEFCTWQESISSNKISDLPSMASEWVYCEVERQRKMISCQRQESKLKHGSIFGLSKVYDQFKLRFQKVAE